MKINTNNLDPIFANILNSFILTNSTNEENGEKK